MSTGKPSFLLYWLCTIFYNRTHVLQSNFLHVQFIFYQESKGYSMCDWTQESLSSLKYCACAISIWSGQWWQVIGIFADNTGIHIFEFSTTKSNYFSGHSVPYLVFVISFWILYIFQWYYTFYIFQFLSVLGYVLLSIPIENAKNMWISSIMKWNC